MNRRLGEIVIGLVAGLALASTVTATTGCDDSGEVDDAALADAPLPDGSMCCPLEEPTCDCFYTGGSPGEQGYCSAICDAEPDGWVSDVDENGCPVLRWVGGTGSCLPWPDAGVDAGLDAGADAG